MRGSMTFDDYNYDVFNKYILIDPERDEQDENKVDLGGFVPQVIIPGKNKKNLQIDSQSEAQLTEKNLEMQEYSEGNYGFRELDVETANDKIQAAQ